MRAEGEADWWTYIHSNGKRYRYSTERKPSGRPAYVNLDVGSTDEKWVVVRNVDTLDGIWNVSNGLPFDHDHLRGQ